MGVQRILIGTDGSEGATKAMVWCAGLAAQLGAEVVAIYAYSPIDELARHHGVELGTLAQEAAARLHDEWCAPLAEAGVDYRSHLVEDLPIDALGRTCAEESPDLVVIGSHGESGWRDKILGRTATHLPHAVTCPIAIVPHDRPGA